LRLANWYSHQVRGIQNQNDLALTQDRGAGQPLDISDSRRKRSNHDFFLAHQLINHQSQAVAVIAYDDGVAQAVTPGPVAGNVQQRPQLQQRQGLHLPIADHPPVLDLRELLDVPGNGTERAGTGYAVVVGEDRDRLGVLVDELVGQEEIVIRPLPPAIGNIQGLAGATILGEGQVVFDSGCP